MQTDNAHLEVIAHDFNSPYLRNRIFTSAFLQYEELLGVPGPLLGIISQKDTIEYITDISTWIATHEALKKKALSDDTFVNRLIDDALEHGTTMNKWTEKEIFTQDLQKLSGSEIMDLYKKFSVMQSKVYAYGAALVLLDFQGFSYVEGTLNKYLQENISSEDKRKEYYSVFTTPIENSFAQQQEKDLLALMSRYFDTTAWSENVMHQDVEQLKRTHPDFVNDLTVHTKKYCWVYYVYAGPAFTVQQFLEFIQDHISKGIDPAIKLEEIKNSKDNLLRKKKEYLEQLDPDEKTLRVIQLAGRVVWAKPTRKDLQSRSYYHVEKLTLEIAKRLSLSLSQVRSAPIDVLERALDSNSTDTKTINAVDVQCVLFPVEQKVKMLIADEAASFSKNRVKRISKTEHQKDISEIRGSCAYTGTVEGIVRIVNCPSDMNKMTQGDILVSTATTPSIIMAMKKAGAIVTNEGGLTCHAAIVSRELKIPCVVGTKNGTHILKDGMKVTVHADDGRVKIKL